MYPRISRTILKKGCDRKTILDEDDVIYLCLVRDILKLYANFVPTLHINMYKK